MTHKYDKQCECATCKAAKEKYVARANKAAHTRIVNGTKWFDEVCRQNQ